MSTPARVLGSGPTVLEGCIMPRMAALGYLRALSKNNLNPLEG